jgi:hypothetical protein
MPNTPRSLVVPIVVAVGTMAILVGAHTLLFASNFCSFYDAYMDGNDGAVPVPTFVFYRRFYGLGPLIALMVLSFATRLAFRAQVPVVHVAWFVSLCGILLFAWFLFTLVVERILFFQYALPV